MPDIFAYVEHGAMNLALLTGRTPKGLARIEDAVLLNPEAAAELAQAFINIRAKYSEPVNGSAEAPIPTIAKTKRALEVPPPSSTDVYDWLLENGPQTRDAVHAHFKCGKHFIHNRLWYLKNQSRMVVEHSNGTFEAIPYGAPVPVPKHVAPKPRTNVGHEGLLAFIRENPGQPSRVIRERLGMDQTDWHSAVDYLRRKGLAHVEPNGGYYLGKAERELTREERSAIARMQHARNFTPIGDNAFSEVTG